jgi:hypothetical protein
MKLIETEFSQELANLLVKYKKSIASDKNGIYIVNNNSIVDVLISTPTTPCEDSRDKLVIIEK